MQDDMTSHWDSVYSSRPETALTWFETEPETSLALMRQLAEPDDPVIDVGGGASRLPDLLLAARYTDISVLDLSATALSISKSRLGPDAARIHWMTGDVTRWKPGRLYRLWHDRAVFHFLTTSEARNAYLNALDASIASGGHAIIATFAEDGPEMCSSLPVVRYAPEDLDACIKMTLPGRFNQVLAQRHVHTTPMGREQRFQVSVFRRV